MQGRLKFIIDPTPFNFLVFVIYNMDSQGKIKGYTIVDIQKLSNLVIFDSYSPFLHSKIITNIKRCHNLAILNIASFFYQ